MCYMYICIVYIIAMGEKIPISNKRHRELWNSVGSGFPNPNQCCSGFFLSQSIFCILTTNIMIVKFSFLTCVFVLLSILSTVYTGPIAQTPSYQLDPQNYPSEKILPLLEPCKKKPKPIYCGLLEGQKRS